MTSAAIRPTTIVFDLDFQAQTWQRENATWAAKAQKLGITVFADDEAAALARLQDTVIKTANDWINHTRSGAEEFRDYLTRLGIPFTYRERAPLQTGSKKTYFLNAVAQVELNAAD